MYFYDDEKQFSVFDVASHSVEDMIRSHRRAIREHEILLKWRRRKLARLLADSRVDWTPTQRRVLLLTAKHNKTQTEIAKLLSITQPSVNKHLGLIVKKAHRHGYRAA